MADFNLRHAIRDVLNDSAEADPGVIAELVFAQIGPRDRAEALRQSLRIMVRQVVSESRISLRDTVSRPPMVASSSKVAGIRSWHRQLQSRVHVGGTEWKLLGDCGYADLMACAAERIELADRNRAWAERYAGWAELVQTHGVARLRDVPESVLAVVLGDAA